MARVSDRGLGSLTSLVDRGLERVTLFKSLFEQLDFMVSQVLFLP